MTSLHKTAALYPLIGVLGLKNLDELFFLLALQAKLVVHMTSISQYHNLVSHQGFRLSNVQI
jgi:hypothetical protein